MRVLYPATHQIESICDFLRANGINPSRVPLQPLTYDGRKREIRVQHIVCVDGIPQVTPDRSEFLTVAARHRVVRGREPSKYLGK